MRDITGDWVISVRGIDILIGLSSYLFMLFRHARRVFLDEKEEKQSLSPASRLQDEIIAAQLLGS